MVKIHTMTHNNITWNMAIPKNKFDFFKKHTKNGDINEKDFKNWLKTTLSYNVPFIQLAMKYYKGGETLSKSISLTKSHFRARKMNISSKRK